MAETVTIERVGAQGDGIAHMPAGPQFVPLALPGETWRQEGGDWVRLTDAPDRATPACRHFGRCGGCAAQHMAPSTYAAWKRGILLEAFRHRGLMPEIAPAVTVGPGTRRRAVLSARRLGRDVVLGYHARASEAVVAIAECPVATPAIAGALPALREIADAVLGGDGSCRLAVLDTGAGLDVAIEAGRVDPPARARLGEIAARAGVLRISAGGEPVVLQQAPRLVIDGLEVAPPAGAFTQASAAAEAAMIGLVTAAVGKARRIADLFCGLGTFALPMARRARVLAVDGDAAALAALAAAARRPGLKPVETLRRDLFREPLSRAELAGLDAVVLDPPRAGAKAQAEALARAGVATIVYVSCNPATLARDARTLVEGGYRLARVTPVDQFLWAAHVEAVANFAMSGATPARRPRAARDARR
jgi:23S rRNA (uracil1939-C5)-methyltransferase